MVTTSSQLLNKILIEAEQSRLKRKPFLAIFDLDSTLFEVAPRITYILKEFGVDPEMAKQFPAECVFLQQATPFPDSYGVRRALERLGMPDPSPEFKKSIVDFWRERFFHDLYLKHDAVYPGAQKFIEALVTRGAQVLYLTGRDQHRMLTGTIEKLKADGFPLVENAPSYIPHPEMIDFFSVARSDGKTPTGHLFVKPHKDMEDAQFKHDFFREIDQVPGSCYFFENEPVNIALVDQEFPDVGIIFVDTVHSGDGPEPGSHIPRIKNFLF